MITVYDILKILSNEQVVMVTSITKLDNNATLLNKLSIFEKTKSKNWIKIFNILKF